MPQTSPHSSSNKKLNQSVLAISQYRWLLLSNLVFFVGMHGQILTRSYLAWDLTQDEMALAYINVSYALPMLLFSALGGALVDRFERRTITQLAQLCIVINEAVLLLLLVSDQIEFWHLMISGFVAGTVIPVLMAGRTALVFNVVGDSLLGKATAYSMGAVNVSRVLGPAMMGIVLAASSVAGAYAVATLLYLFAFIFLTFVDKKAVQPVQAFGLVTLFKEVKEGISYVNNHHTIRSSMTFSFMIMFLAMPLQNLFILFTDEVWQVGEAGLGLLMSVAGVGGVIGSIWVAARSEHKNRLRPMVNGGIALTICFAAFSLSPSFYLALIPLALANGFTASAQTLNNTVIQILVNDEQRGRVSSLMMMAYGFTPLGVLPLAWMARHIGIQWSVFTGSIILFVAILLFYRKSPSLRSLDEAVDSHRRRTTRHKTLTAQAGQD